MSQQTTDPSAAEALVRLSAAVILGAFRRRGNNGRTLSESEYLALEALAGAGVLHPGALAALVSGSPAKATRVINALTSHDPPLASVSITAADRRCLDVTITDAGRQALGSFRAERSAVAQALLARLDPDQLAQLRELLAELLPQRKESLHLNSSRA